MNRICQLKNLFEWYYSNISIIIFLRDYLKPCFILFFKYMQHRYDVIVEMPFRRWMKILLNIFETGSFLNKLVCEKNEFDFLYRSPFSKITNDEKYRTRTLIYVWSQLISYIGRITDTLSLNGRFHKKSHMKNWL